MSLAMTSAERDEFLLAHDTGVLIVIGEGETFALPSWYDYVPGGTIGFVVGQGARRLRALDAADCVVGLTVHEEVGDSPAFVTAFGSIVVNRDLEPSDMTRVWPTMVRALGGEEMAQRYVAMGGDRFLRGLDTADDGATRRVEIQPTRWTSCDYRKTGERGDIMRGV